MNPDVLSRLPENELMAELTAIPGIDPWTVQGALLIALQREDVVLPGDLALRKATARIAVAAPPGAASAAPATPRPPVIARTCPGQFWLW
jgi:DNA-3-methyladenine glycosylase II